MSESVPLATGDIDAIDRLHGSPDHVLITCPERSGSCAYIHGADRPDDYDLLSLLDRPHCSACGCSLVMVPRGSYDGPRHRFRSLEASVKSEGMELMP